MTHLIILDIPLPLTPEIGAPTKSRLSLVRIDAERSEPSADGERLRFFLDDGDDYYKAEVAAAQVVHHEIVPTPEAEAVRAFLRQRYQIAEPVIDQAEAA